MVVELIAAFLESDHLDEAALARAIEPHVYQLDETTQPRDVAAKVAAAIRVVGYRARKSDREAVVHEMRRLAHEGAAHGVPRYLSLDWAPRAYSFVPNLVWLPSQVAALTDREASFVQSYTQAISIKIYRHVPVHSSTQASVDEAWSLLPVRDDIPQQGPPSAESLNFFRPSDRWLTERLRKIRNVANALDAVAKGKAVTTKVSTRYVAGLPAVNTRAARRLRDTLLTLASSLDT